MLRDRGGEPAREPIREDGGVATRDPTREAGGVGLSAFSDARTLGAGLRTEQSGVRPVIADFRISEHKVGLW
jgi:hypothetical protein